MRIAALHIYTDGSGDSGKKSDDEKTPTWAFIVLAELDWQGSNVFRVMGFQAGFLHVRLNRSTGGGSTLEAS